MKFYLYSAFFLFFLNFNCKSSFLKKNPQLNEAYSDSVLLLNNEHFGLALVAQLSYDTLSEDYSFDEKYDSPIVLKQSLIFYENGQEVKKYLPPFDKSSKMTTKNAKLEVVDIVIWDVCLESGSQEDFYYLYGSGFCAGSNCPEFFGIYNMHGKIIYEGYSTSGQDNANSFEDVLNNFGIDIKKPKSCIKSDKYWSNQ